MTYTVSATGYQKACALIERLKQAGIEANITVGGIDVWFGPDGPTPEALQKATAIVAASGHTLHNGDTFLRSTQMGAMEMRKYTRAQADADGKLGICEKCNQEKKLLWYNDEAPGRYLCADCTVSRTLGKYLTIISGNLEGWE